MTIENKIMDAYYTGAYTPTGKDGGVLNYIQCIIDDKAVNASITEDNEIAKIRSVWEVRIDGVKLYDFTREYYKLRK